jgi:excisionase family DNA binding protein
MARPDDLIGDFLDGDALLTTEEVAALLRVDPKTVSRWAAAGRFPDTPTGRPGAIQLVEGGQWRIYASVVRGLLDGTIKPRETS